MQRLGTNALDIVLIHDVNRRWQGDLVEQRYARGDGGAHQALVELRAAGTIKAFGVGVNDWSILLRFAADGDFDCFMLAGRYTLLDHTALDDVHAGLRAPRHLSADGGAVQFGHPRDRRARRARRSSTSRPTRRSKSARAASRPCAHATASRLRAAAIQFPLHHPAVASVVTGMRNAEEAQANLAHCQRRHSARSSGTS